VTAIIIFCSSSSLFLTEHISILLKHVCDIGIDSEVEPNLI